MGVREGTIVGQSVFRMGKVQILTTEGASSDLAGVWLMHECSGDGLDTYLPLTYVSFVPKRGASDSSGMETETENDLIDRPVCAGGSHNSLRRGSSTSSSTR